MSLPKGWTLADEETALPEGWTLAEPESNVAADAVRRFSRETGASGGQAVAGFGRFGEIGNAAALKLAQIVTGTPSDPAIDRIILDSPGMPGTGKMLRKGGQFVTDAAREAYATDPARDETLVAKLAQGAGSLPAAIASGPAAPITVAAMMGEQGAEDARTSLARRGITDPAQVRSAEDAAFLVNAPVGAASEALLGVPKLLKAARLMEGTTAATRIGRQFATTAAREGTQEGIEQLAQNVGARDIVGYDPKRDRTAGVGESVMLGALIGGPLGASVQGAQEIDARTRHAEFAARLDTAQNIPESTKTLLLQQDQLVQGLRPAQMFPKGSPELPLPDGLERLETERGIFHYNPRQIRGDNLKLLSDQGRENEILALGPVSKPEAEARARATGEPVVSVTERAADGTEIKTAVGTTGTAAAQVAALNATKSPGSTVAVESPRQTITERLRAQQIEQEEQARAVLAREQQERDQRQQELADKRVRFEETLLAADALALDPQADFTKLKAALTSLDAAIEDNSIGLNLDQRAAALARVAKIRPRAEAVRAQFEAEAAARVAAAKAEEQARQAAAMAARRAEREAIDTIEATGRDPREGGKIVDITKVPDAEFEALQNNLAAAGLDLRAWEKEMNRRIREQEADGGPGVPRYSLLDLFTGANGAKEWSSSRLTLPTPAALRAAGDPLAGDMEAIRESLPFSYFRKDSKGDLDGLAASLRELGFRDATTPAAALDLIRRAAGGEDIRPTASADFAAAPTGWGEIDTSTPDSPRFLTETEVAQQFAALRSALGPIAQQFDVQTGLVADLLDAEGYTRDAEALRAGRLGNIQAANAPRLKSRITALNAQRHFIVIGADAAKKGRAPGLLLHELAHPFFDGLPVDTRAVLRQMHAEETRTRTGPLYADGKLVTPLSVEASQFPPARLRATPDLPVQEWFAERVRLLNEAWLDGRVAEADKPILRRLWDQLIARLREIFAQVRRLDQRDDLFVETFRDWLRTGNEANIAPAAASYAARQRAAFATSQAAPDFSASDRVFADAVDAVANGSWDKTRDLPVGNTPPVLIQSGADPLPVVMAPSIVGKVTGDRHNLPLSTIKAIPAALRDPVFVFDSASVPDAQVVVTELREGKSSVMVAIHLNRRGYRTEVNRITSIYDKTNELAVPGWMEAGLLRYAHQQKGRVWFQSRGLQLPKVGTKRGNSKLRTEADIVNPGRVAFATEAEDSSGPPDGGAPFLTRDEFGDASDAAIKAEYQRVSRLLLGKKLGSTLRTDLYRLRTHLIEEAQRRDMPALDVRATAAAPVKTGADLERENEAADARISDAAKSLRHPAAVGEVEAGAAWPSVAKLTPDQLREQVTKIDDYINDNALDLSDIEKANLQAVRAATEAELARRKAAEEKPAERKPTIPVDVAGTPVPGIIKPDPEDALIAQWRRGKALRDEGRRTGNEIAEDEGQAIVTRTKAALDLRFPGWEAKANPPAAAKPAPAKPRTDVRPDQIEQDDGRNLPPPPPDEPRDTLPPAGDPPPPNRGRAAQAWGHTAVTPSWFAKRWEQARAALVGIRGSIPELPAFPALAAKSDRFIRDQGANFYDGLRAFYRALSSGNDYIQRTAEEKVAAITTPLLRLGGRFAAEDYKRYQSRLEQSRRLAADGRPMPRGAAAELAALEARLESSPYVLFSKLVYFMDLDWRGRNLKDSAGNPIRLPSGLNSTEIEAELARLGSAIAANPHAEAIERAYDQHRALVANIAAELKNRDLLAAEHLANPVYFPHLTLEITKGDKVEQRELRPERVRVGTEADFRGYLQDPVGSTKPIESDYMRAMYYHLVQVGAHNFKADAIRDHVRPYDIRAEVEARAKELSKQRGVSVSWEQAFHEEYAPRGYVLYGTDSRDAFPTVQIDRDKLARRLGVILTSEDLHKQLEALGLRGIKLLPEDLKETLVQGQRETWIVPARVAEALRGIADRQTQTDGPIDAALRAVNGAWKAWKLFMPQNHVRYEYGNMVADLEKIFSASPRTFRFLGQSAKEMREFFNGGIPSADLRAALKDGVINAITAQEMNQLQRLRAFEKFETAGEKLWRNIKKRSSSALYQPITNLVGLGDLSSVELSAFREGVTRYANYLANLDAIRNGARPDYAGAYWRDIEAIRDSRPGAGDRAQRQAAQISKATFGDYGDLSVTGQYLRDKLITFYSWMEVNFKYHANLFRNLRDMVKGDEITPTQAAGRAGRAALSLAAGTGSRLAGGFVLRLLFPYAIAMIWNASGFHGVDDDELSEEDRRRFHIRLGHDEDGKALVIYGNTAFADVMKWFSGPAFVQHASAWMSGRTDFPTAFAAWRDQILPDLANNTVGSFGPTIKIPATYITKKAFFPDVLDARTIPDYDMRRAIWSQITDDFTADQIERIVSKDYAAPKDYGDWAQQLVLQVRRRDPESWAFYSIKDKAAAFVEERTGQSRDNSYNAPDQQVLRNFRRAIYKGDVEQASRFYLRLLDLGYTAERFTASIRAQDPLAALPKESGLRSQFVESLDEFDREQLRRAYAHYTRMTGVRGAERVLFPSKASGERGLERYQASPRLDVLERQIDRREQLTPEEELRRADYELRRSLAK